MWKTSLTDEPRLSRAGCVAVQGHPHSFRLDVKLSKKDSKLDGKFIISVATGGEKGRWVQSLARHGAAK